MTTVSNLSPEFAEKIRTWAGEALTDAIVEEYQQEAGIPSFQLEGFVNPERTIRS